MPDPSLEDRIIADIEKTGFPVEISIANVLRAGNWTVGYQSYYEDLDSHKGNVIDLTGGKLHVASGGRPERLTIRMIIECKKRTNNPWVFYSPGRIYEDYDLAVLGAARICTYHAEYQDALPVLRRSHYLNGTPIFSVLALEAFTHGENESTHEAVSQVLTASRYEQKRIQDALNAPGFKPFNSAIVVLYPIIVFDGPMFVMTVDAEGKLRVESKEHVVHQAQFAEQPYWIDVLKKDTFSSFVSAIDMEGGWFSNPPSLR